MEIIITVSEEDHTYVQSLPEAGKMKFFSEDVYYIYQTKFLCSLVDARQGDVLDMGNPSKERDIWNGKCKDTG